MKITTDSCLFGAWVAERVKSQKSEPDSNRVRNQKSKIDNVLDIGTGTGLLSLMLAQKNSISIHAVEIDQDAFIQSSENIAGSPWKERIKLFHADIKDFIPNIKYDSIICNPPFYENELPSENSKRNIAHHSSNLLLEDLLAFIAVALKPSGRFYLLLPYKRHAAILDLLDRQQLFLVQKILVRQSEEHDFFRFMIEACLEKPADTVVTELAIKNKNNEYTAEFTALLKDYYLYI